ncbi:MAG TPA: DinB family protein [Candidatus Polarisedimenticolia bacterium]|nr:DinB family protein [Candidatus Polarisedimenticolia bacterium]
MTPAERDRARDYLHKTSENLLGATRGLSQSQLAFRPAPDRWSIAQCLEHIIVVENFVHDRIVDALRQPADSSKRSAYEGKDEALIERIVGRVERAQAPEIVHPAGRWPHDRLLPEFRAARGRSLDLVAKTTAQPRQCFFPHPVFGPLDCYQWMLLIGAHGDRHRIQIEEVAASPGFPSAAQGRATS